MCGIVGYVGKRDALDVLIGSLERLAYRGYDSAGVAVLDGKDRAVTVVKEKGKIERLKEKLRGRPIAGRCGLGHTRWATHGVPSNVNAHPHFDARRAFVVVHNGIIENHAALRRDLTAKGVRFLSQTDTEVSVHLIAEAYRGDLLAALRAAVHRMKGDFALVAATSHEPDTIAVFRRSNPVVIGLGQGESFIASDVAALLPYTRRVLYLHDGEFARLTGRGVELFGADGRRVHRAPALVTWSVEQAQKGGYAHFMLKEIEEQPRVLADILKVRVPGHRIVFDTLPERFAARLKGIDTVHWVSCGTAHHAGLVGMYMVQDAARINSEAHVASEFRYQDPLVARRTLVIVVSQSGETADSLAALREAKKKGALTIGLVNVVGSTIAREADHVIYTHAGPEIGVASTKAYVAQLATAALFSLYLGGLRGTRSQAYYRQHLEAIRRLPDGARKVLRLRGHIQKVARALYRKRNFLYLARGFNFPNALEGALKLKEISYIHAHGYAAGEMKHGPIALVDSDLPVVCLAPQSKTYEKMLSNVEETKARKGIVVAVVTEGDREVARHADHVIAIPAVPEFVSPVLTAIPLQLLAYEIAVLKKTDVDQPKNLAKSVTVE